MVPWPNGPPDTHTRRRLQSPTLSLPLPDSIAGNLAGIKHASNSEAGCVAQSMGGCEATGPKRPSPLGDQLAFVCVVRSAFPREIGSSPEPAWEKLEA